jgi:hypothetical protein
MELLANIDASHELAIYIELRIGGPVRKLL